MQKPRDALFRAPGVYSDRSLEKVEKEYNYSGPTAYTEILTSAGVDCVTLANNHSHDQGEAGYADTKAAPESAGVGWFGTDAPRATERRYRRGRNSSVLFRAQFI